MKQLGVIAAGSVVALLCCGGPAALAGIAAALLVGAGALTHVVTPVVAVAPAALAAGAWWFWRHRHAACTVERASGPMPVERSTPSGRSTAGAPAQHNGGAVAAAERSAAR